MGWSHLGRFDVPDGDIPQRAILAPPDSSLIRPYAVRMLKFPLDFRSE
jgi:hypothetical protein